MATRRSLSVACVSAAEASGVLVFGDGVIVQSV